MAVQKTAFLLKSLVRQATPAEIPSAAQLSEVHPFPTLCPPDVVRVKLSSAPPALALCSGMMGVVVPFPRMGRLLCCEPVPLCQKG